MTTQDHNDATDRVTSNYFRELERGSDYNDGGFEGGQGRSAESVLADASIMTWAIIFFVAAIGVFVTIFGL